MLPFHKLTRLCWAVLKGYRVFRFVSGEAPAAVLPLLAVVIPVYATTQQDVALLQRALRHLARQEGRPPTHVVLVDDASPRSLNVSYAGGGQVLAPCPPHCAAWH